MTIGGDSKKTYFSPMPLRAMGDARLTALDHRVLQCVAFHDRMSAARGKGQGAWASNRTMAVKVGCDQTSLSSAITRLAKAGYITREQHHFDKRKHVYRVVYEGDDSFPPEKPNEPGSDPNDFPAEQHSPEIVSRVFENAQSSQEDEQGKYIPLSGRTYSVETGEIDSPEGARLASRGLANGEKELPLAANLSRFERALSRNPASVVPVLPEWSQYLDEIAENECGTPEGNQAQRISEKVSEFIDTMEWELGGEDPVKDSFQSCWSNLNRDQRERVACRHGMSRDEIDRILIGRGEVSFAKLVALRGTAMSIEAGRVQ